MSDLKYTSDISDQTSTNPHPLVYKLVFRWKTELFKVLNVETPRTNTLKSDIRHPTSEIFLILPHVNAQ